MANYKNETQTKLEVSQNAVEDRTIFKKTQNNLKSLIAPAGIDAGNTNHLEIVSTRTRYARSMIVSALPRMCTFPEFLRGMYTFGDINVSVFINPISESTSQTDLNRKINEIESERIVALDRGDINRERVLAQKRLEAEELRDGIAAGFNKLFDSTIVATIFAYSIEELDRYTELLTNEMSKTLIDIKPAWAMQDVAFRSNMPYCDNKISKSHVFDRNAMSTVFPFFISDVGHEDGIPLGFNKQTGLPILYNNFSSSLTNYNMIIFGKSGAGKSVTIKTLTARSSILMGIESLALDAEGEYGAVAEALGGVNIVISPNSKTVINLFDIEPEVLKDEITGRERLVLNVENKVEDVTQGLLTMARGSTKSTEVNELTKQIISEACLEEYTARGINNNVESLYITEGNQSVKSNITNNYFGRTKKEMPTIGSWYKRICRKAKENENPDYRFHYSYLVKVMKQYVRELQGQMAYFDGQSTFDLLDGMPFINLDISQLEERFARPLAQQVLLSWVWEKYVKKNSEDKSKASKKRVLVDEAWMLLPYPEAVDFLNTMARRARKRNVSLAVISQKFQDFYEKPEAQAVLTSSETKLFLAQDKAEIEYLKEVFKLSEGEAGFLITCGRGEGLLRVGQDSAILAIQPTAKEFEFVETNLSKQIEMEKRKQSQQ